MQISNDKITAKSKKSSKDSSKAFTQLDVLLEQTDFPQSRRAQKSNFVYNSDNPTWYN